MHQIQTLNGQTHLNVDIEIVLSTIIDFTTLLSSEAILLVPQLPRKLSQRCLHNSIPTKYCTSLVTLMVSVQELILVCLQYNMLLMVA